MMRFQRGSPDYLQLTNGRKPSIRTSYKDAREADPIVRIHGLSSFETKALRVRSAAAGSTSTTTHVASSSAAAVLFATNLPNDSLAPPPFSSASAVHHNEANFSTGHTGGGGGDVLLQWGHNKRSRGSRTTAGDDPSPISRQAAKIQRRGISAAVAPPLPLPPCSSYIRGTNLRACPALPIRDSSSLLARGTEERSATGGHYHHRPDKQSPPSPPEKPHRSTAVNGTAAAPPEHHHHHQPEQDTGGGAGPAPVAAEKLNLDQFEWPRIYISLSRKEKEDDFLAMKGTKLPQRPKKRAKSIDKTLQYCFPGMWLSDLTRGRYEVREKKCVKKKRRGLKGMESVDSDSG